MVAPTVTAVSPNSVSILGGTVISVSGTGFQVSPPAVTIGSYACQLVTVVSDTFLTCIVPSVPSPFSSNIVVTTTAGSSVTGGANAISYTFPAVDGASYSAPNYFFDPAAAYTVWGPWVFGGGITAAGLIVQGAITATTLTVSGLATFNGAINAPSSATITFIATGLMSLQGGTMNIGTTGTGAMALGNTGKNLTLGGNLLAPQVAFVAGAVGAYANGLLPAGKAYLVIDTTTKAVSAVTPS